MPVVELADFRPTPRHDGQPWTSVRVEEADDPADEWVELTIVALDEPDEVPSKPDLRSITASPTKAWARLVFLAGEEEDIPREFVAVGMHPFLPTVAAVSTILRARTFVDGSVLEDGPPGGAEVGVFDATTHPTGAEVEGEIIPQACRDVALALGRVPGERMADARRVATLKAAAEIERSYIPEQAEGSQTIFQTLRLTYESELGGLQTALQWWVLSRNLEQR